MEGKLLRSLPEHLLEIIIAKIPVEDLVRFKSVSKRWMYLLSSPSFTKLCSERHEPRPWLIMFSKHDQHRICRAYDTFRQKWRLISLAFLPRHRQHDLQLLVASSQLLCFATRSADFGHLLICNPLAKTWRSLALPINSSGLTQNSHANHPAIAMATTAIDEDVLMMVSNSTAAIYNSRLDVWNTNIDLAPRSNLRSEAVFCGGNFYFITLEPIEVLAFSLRQSAWKTMEAPAPHDSLVFARLVTCKDRVFIAGGVGPDGIAKGLCFWELDGLKPWRKVDTAPDAISKMLFSASYHNYDHIYCFGHGEFICVSCMSWPEVLIYSLTRRSWHWVPPCPLRSRMAASGFQWVSFVPTLNSVV